jgi:hypothetical protein
MIGIYRRAQALDKGSAGFRATQACPIFRNSRNGNDEEEGILESFVSLFSTEKNVRISSILDRVIPFSKLVSVDSSPGFFLETANNNRFKIT